MRTKEIIRHTKETNIELKLNIDGSRQIDIETKVPFLNHMLTLFAFHSGFDLFVKANGDIEIDDHHTVEDIGITLGKAFRDAIQDQKGIFRYGMSYVPMDDALARVVLDVSNRSFLVYQANFTRETIGGLSLENVEEFFKSFVNEARINLHIEVLYGKNDHHKVEAMFKAFGRALKDATRIISNEVLSSKGMF